METISLCRVEGVGVMDLLSKFVLIIEMHCLQLHFFFIHSHNSLCYFCLQQVNALA